MSLVSADKGQAGDGPHPPFGQLESRVSSLAQNLEMRRLPGGACYKGASTRSRLECRTPSLTKHCSGQPSACLSGNAPF